MAKQGSMIRDLIINVKASDLSGATKEAQKLIDALADSAAGAELLKAELNSTNTSLKNITRNASSAAKVFSNFSLNEKFKSSLNSILEGINRIKASAKDLNGLDIGINLKVDNLTELQNDVSKSIQGLDISINLKSGNMKATNDRIQEIVNSLQDAAVGVELLNSQMQETSVLIRAIKTDATIAGDALMKIAISKNLENGLDDVLHSLNNIAEEIVQLNLDTKDSFSSLEHSIDRVDDSLGAMTSTLNRSRIIQKGTKEETKKLSESTSLLGSAYETLGLKIGKATEGSRNHTRIMGDLAKLAGPIPAAFAIISAHVWALTAAFDQLAQGDSLNRLENIGNTIGANIGVPVQKVAAVMVDATNGAISYENALRKAANVSAYGFSTKEIEKMAIVARRAAVVMGVDMDDALNRVTRGVAKQEVEILDDLGITINLTKAQNDYAKALGTTADKLTTTQKQQAYLQGVLAQSEKSFGFLTESDLGATNIEILGAKFDELANSARQAIAELSNDVLGKYFGFGSSVSVSEKGLEDIIKSMDSFVESFSGAAKGGNVKAVIGLLSDQSNDGSKALDEARTRVANLLIEFNKLKKLSDENPFDLFIREDMNKMGAAYLSQAKILQQLSATYNKSMEIGAQYLDVSNLSLKDRKDAIQALADAMQANKGATDSSKAAVDEFGAALTKAGKQTSVLTDGFDKYLQALIDIEDMYSKIDKIEVEFPNISDSILNKMREYADEVARAAGFTTRGQSRTALDSASNLRDFEQQHRFDENTYTEMGNVRGNLSGENDVAIEQKKLAVAKERLIKAEAVVVAAGKEEESAAQIMGIKKEILEIEGRLANASMTRLQATQAMSQAELRMFSAWQKASPLHAAAAEVNILDQELILLKQNREQLEAAGLNREKILELDAGIYEKQMQVNQAHRDAILYQIQYKSSLDEVSAAQNEYNALVSGVPTEIIASKKAQDDLNNALATQIALTKSLANGTEGTKQEQVVAADLAVERAKLAKMQAIEAEVQAFADRDAYTLQLRTAELNLGELEVAKAQLANDKQHLDNLIAQGDQVSQIVVNTQKLAYEESKRRAQAIEDARYREMIAGGIGAIQGENQMQYTSTAGMDKESAKLSQQADGLANIANSFDQLAQYDQPFANVAANLSQMAIAIQDNASAMQIASIAGQAITSMFQMNGQAAIDSIDAQIAAEEKRDGKSAQSLAKIRALEAKKIETTRKTARQTIIMQTAVGVANALAMGNPFIGIPMAIAVAAMGMQALKAADSAAESSLAGLDSAEATGSLTLGDRTNKVDTAQTANSGELSYIQGADGIGGIQNFTPRASGGTAYAGHSYIVGEKGPELWTPKVDSMVSDAQSTRSGSSGAANVTLNIQALDARSFADLVYTDPQLFQNVVEMSLNQQGKTLG